MKDNSKRNKAIAEMAEQFATDLRYSDYEMIDGEPMNLSNTKLTMSIIVGRPTLTINKKK